MAVCAVASVGLRGRVLESDFFVCFDLRTVKEMLDKLEADGHRTALRWKTRFVVDSHAEHDMEALVTIYVRAFVDKLYSLSVTDDIKAAATYEDSGPLLYCQRS